MSVTKKQLIQLLQDQEMEKPETWPDDKLKRIGAKYLDQVQEDDVAAAYKPLYRKFKLDGQIVFDTEPVNGIEAQLALMDKEALLAFAKEKGLEVAFNKKHSTKAAASIVLTAFRKHEKKLELASIKMNLPSDHVEPAPAKVEKQVSNKQLKLAPVKVEKSKQPVLAASKPAPAKAKTPVQAELPGIPPAKKAPKKELGSKFLSKEKKKDLLPRDKFGCIIGNKSNKVNAVMSKKWQTVEEIVASSGLSLAEVRARLYFAAAKGEFEKQSTIQFRIATKPSEKTE